MTKTTPTFCTIVNEDESAPFESIASSPRPAPTLYLDCRSEAITVCALWDAALDRAVRASVGKFGLVRTSHLVAAARCLEPQVAQKKPEHPDAHAARLACIDWIAYKVSGGPAIRSKKSVQYLSRFFWGYLEGTTEFVAYFEARKNGQRLTGTPIVPLPITRQCSVGCAYGAPTLASLSVGTGGQRGRGQWPAIFIDDKAYAVLAKNKSASTLMHLSSLPNRELRDEQGVLKDKIADALISISALDNPVAWPKFVVQRAGEPRQVLHLAIGRRGSGVQSLAEDKHRWLKVKHGLFEALSERQLCNFISDEVDGKWGSFEQLLWHLTVAPKNARKQSAMFASLPVNFSQPEI